LAGAAGVVSRRGRPGYWYGRWGSASRCTDEHQDGPATATRALSCRLPLTGAGTARRGKCRFGAAAAASPRMPVDGVRVAFAVRPLLSRAFRLRGPGIGWCGGDSFAQDTRWRRWEQDSYQGRSREDHLGARAADDVNIRQPRDRTAADCASQGRARRPGRPKRGRRTALHAAGGGIAAMTHALDRPVKAGLSAGSS